MVTNIRLFLTIAVFLCLSTFAYSQADPEPNNSTLFGIASTPDDGPSFLWSIDIHNAQSNQIGPVGFNNTGGMDFHPDNNTLFATSERPGDFTEVLITVDTNTGHGTEVGPLNIPSGFISGLSFNPDGTLFANLSMKGGNILGTINTDTGNFVEIGPTGFPEPGDPIGFSMDGTILWGSSLINFQPSLTIANQVSGVGSLVRPFNIPVLPIDDPVFNALDTNPRSGQLFGTLSEPQNNMENVVEVLVDNFLAVIDVATGDVFILGPIPPSMNALAFLNPIPRPIPTLSHYGLILAAVVLLAAALYVLRHRRKSLRA